MYEVQWTLLPLFTAAALLKRRKTIATHFMDAAWTVTPKP